MLGNRLVLALKEQSGTYGLMRIKNALIQIAAEEDVDIVLQAGRRDKSYRTKCNTVSTS
jgi:hypothetical protein